SINTTPERVILKHASPFSRKFRRQVRFQARFHDPVSRPLSVPERIVRARDDLCFLSGPLTGHPVPQHGGTPDRDGCNGCIDCCHLPQISITRQEGDRLRELHAQFIEPPEELIIREDPSHPGWQVMNGPCVFRRAGKALMQGGCSIYQDRPATCAIFTCEFRLGLQRKLG
ncbi:MAG: YkgJ family cysteine cluster protein, partial [Chloroflexota bacterium]